ncbi:hypothetical protein GQ600_4157 [Phytophthora cactorum]|nr:hypothetical protein GQ600_4157 [Phytophthora cactorum]
MKGWWTRQQTTRYRRPSRPRNLNSVRSSRSNERRLGSATLMIAMTRMEACPPKKKAVHSR